jgi:hypothetical protein
MITLFDLYKISGIPEMTVCIFLYYLLVHGCRILWIVLLILNAILIFFVTFTVQK